MILEVRGGVATQPTEDAPFQHALGVAPQQSLGLPELDRFQGYIINGLAALGTPWTNMPNLGVQGPRSRGNPNWNAAADLTWLRGNHNFKFGFQMLRISRLQTNQFGELALQRGGHARTRSRRPTPATRIASALLGLPSQIRGFVPDQGYIDFHTSTLSGYVQDQWTLQAEPDPEPRACATTTSRAPTGTATPPSRAVRTSRTGEWLLALEQMPGVCTPAQAPPCLPAPLAQIPFNQFIRATGERDSILQADHGQLRAARGPGLAAQLRGPSCAPATR